MQSGGKKCFQTFRWDQRLQIQNLLLFLTFSVLVANTKKTTLHSGQSHSWPAEQGKENNIKRVNVQQGIPWSTRDTAGYILIYSVKRTQLIGRRPLSPCRVQKTAGYTLPRLLFSKTVPRFSEMYPDLPGSGTLPSAIISARITFRSQQRTPKPKYSCLAVGIASLGGQSAPTKEHQKGVSEAISRTHLSISSS